MKKFSHIATELNEIYDVMLASSTANNRTIEIEMTNRHLLSEHLIGKQFVIGNYSITVTKIAHKHATIHETINGRIFEHETCSVKNLFDFLNLRIQTYHELTNIRQTGSIVEVQSTEYKNQKASLDKAKLELLDLLCSTCRVFDEDAVTLCTSSIDIMIKGRQLTIVLPDSELAEPFIQHKPTQLTANDYEYAQVLSALLAPTVLKTIANEFDLYRILSKQLAKFETTNRIETTRDEQFIQDVHDFINSNAPARTIKTFDLPQILEGQKRQLEINKWSRKMYFIAVVDIYVDETGKELKRYFAYFAKQGAVRDNIVSFVNHANDIYCVMK